MGRSVAIHPEAVAVAYATWDVDYEDYVDQYDDDPEFLLSEEDYYDALVPEMWQDMKEWFVSLMQKLWPSLYPVDRWAGQEVHVVLENSLVEVGVSEYSGLTALSLAPSDRAFDEGQEGLAKKWIKQIEPVFSRTFSDFVKIGTFSNGESVYRRR